MKTLHSEDRLRLLRFVCSFAWADLEVQAEEKVFVLNLIRRLHIPPDEREAVLEMLSMPPRPEDIDPLDVPIEHRKMFVETVRDLMLADGKVDPAEAENLDLFEQLLDM
jgi:hypothetical protein